MERLGTVENPCRNNYEIAKIIRGMLNCKIYTLKTFEISEGNLEQAKARNIVFVGLAVAYFKTPTMIKTAAEVSKKENISKIGIDANTKIPIDLDEIARKITEQFNVNADVFEKQFSKTADQFKTKYLGRWE